MKRFIRVLSAVSLAVIIAGSAVNSDVQADEKKAAKKTTAKDRVCGMEVQKDKALKLEHDGKNYFFCSQQCVDTFNKEPAKYQKKENKHKEDAEKK